MHSDFDAVEVVGPFDKRELDSADVSRRESLVTRGWLRLQEIAGQGLSVAEYPLPEIRSPSR